MFLKLNEIEEVSKSTLLEKLEVAKSKYDLTKNFANEK